MWTKRETQHYRLQHMSGWNTMLFKRRWRMVIVGLRSLWDPLSLRIKVYFASRTNEERSSTAGRIFPFTALLFSLPLLLFSLSQIICYPLPALGQVCYFTSIYWIFGIYNSWLRSNGIYVPHKDDFLPIKVTMPKGDRHIHIKQWFEQKQKPSQNTVEE